MARVEQLEHQVRSGVPLGAANSRTQIKPEPEEKQAAAVAAPAASRVKKAPAVSAVQAPAAEPEPAAAAKLKQSRNLFLGKQLLRRHWNTAVTGPKAKICGTRLWRSLRMRKNSLWWPVPPAVMLQGMKTAF